jgi:hypothetical protein
LPSPRSAPPANAGPAHPSHCGRVHGFNKEHDAS